MKPRLFTLLSIVLFLGVNQSWGQRLEAGRVWVRGEPNFSPQIIGPYEIASRPQSIFNLVYHNDSLFALHWGKTWTDTNTISDPFFYHYNGTYGYQVYSPNLDSLQDIRFNTYYGFSYLTGTSPVGLEFATAIENSPKLSPPKILRSRLGLVSLNLTNDWKDSIYYFQYYKQGKPSKAYKLEAQEWGRFDFFGYKNTSWRFLDMLVTPNGNYWVVGEKISNDASLRRDVLIASYTPFGKLRWTKDIKNVSFYYQELDKWGNINMTIGDSIVKNYVFDTLGNIRKEVPFKIEFPHSSMTLQTPQGDLPKVKKLSNGGYAFTAGDTMGVLTDSNGKERFRVIRNLRTPLEWSFGLGGGYGSFNVNHYNGLYPLEDGGVVYIVPALRYATYPGFFGLCDNAKDSLIKIDENTGKVIWKVLLDPKVNLGYGQFCTSPWVRSVTTSPNGDLYIGGMALFPWEDAVSFIYKISNVGHIYDPIPQASPTATQPQWQERKARLSIFPNPAKRGEAFSYSLPADKAGGVLEIFSADGRKVYSQIITQSSGSVSMPAHLNSGLYLVRAGGLEAKWIIE